ncbi:rod-binding protein [Nitrospina gracilis]|uniref:rod-binding protein n=1 Tax=Nitrospina gracilis TaxID=35801 RepID=UPI001F2CC377|nr:rod-binding protein [Nitrospina gracilis]MCF8719501.1 Rod binding domain-containing protein [Nitrospina gracilis Nb-211]
MDFIPMHTPVNPLGPNAADQAKRLGEQVPTLNPAKALTQSFSQTLAQVKQSGEGEKASGGKQESEKLMEVSRQFEGLLIHQMLKAMRQTVNKTGLLEGFASQQYEAVLDEELSKEVVQHQSIGLAQTLYDQMSRSLPVL